MIGELIQEYLVGLGVRLDKPGFAQAEATIPLVAKKGRASYLGERSAGHKDPGAASSALLLQCLAEAV